MGKEDRREKSGVQFVASTDSDRLALDLTTTAKYREGILRERFGSV